jgi:hypothetical protein
MVKTSQTERKNEKLITEGNKVILVIVLGFRMFYSLASFDVGKEGNDSHYDNGCIDKQEYLATRIQL